MNKRNREIMCINRLQEKTHEIDMLISFLKDESLINDQTIIDIKNSSDRAKTIHEVLKTLHSQNKLQLLEYEWKLLPVEFIKLYIVTDRNQAEFVFNE